MTLLSISKIRLDGGTQPRAEIDFDAVDDYMDAMKDGVKFPPLVVFYDGTDYWLADGFHRREGAFGAGLKEIACDIHQGTREDAQWYSYSANKTNGLRRTNEDKQRAVKAALVHPGGAGKSDSYIAKHVGVDHVTVKNWREKMTASCEIHKMENRTVTRNGTTYQQNTANIGKSQAGTIRRRNARDVGAPEAEPKPEPTPALSVKPDTRAGKDQWTCTGREYFRRTAEMALGMLQDDALEHLAGLIWAAIPPNFQR